MTFPDRPTVRLGDLKPRLQKWCEDNDKTPSEAIRIAIAELVGRKRLPTMKSGNPNFGKEFGNGRSKG